MDYEPREILTTFVLACAKSRRRFVKLSLSTRVGAADVTTIIDSWSRMRTALASMHE